MQIVNFQIMKNPINWLIVIFMLLLAGIGGHLLMSYFGIDPAKNSEEKGSK